MLQVGCVGVIAAIAAVVADAVATTVTRRDPPGAVRRPRRLPWKASSCAASDTDGAPFGAEFRRRRAGPRLDHALSGHVAAVEQGRYEIEVLSIAAASGCGADSEVCSGPS
jgi:hypothetical protein